MWSSLSSLWQVLYTCYGHSSWNYSSPRSKTSPLNHLTYHCLLPPFHTGATRLESSVYFWDRANLYTTFASLKSVYFNLAYLQASLGFVCHAFTSPSVGEKWMRDKQTPKDVYGEANLNPKSNVPVRYIQKSVSILLSVSFDPRSFSFWANVNPSYDNILSCSVKNSI